MKPRQLAAFVLLVHLSLGVLAHAQLPRRPSPSSRFHVNSRPTISPYYDLIERSNNRSFGFQYFRRVRPEVEFRQAENRFQQNLNSLSKRVNESSTRSEPSMLGTTGHAASFLTHGKYFNVR